MENIKVGETCELQNACREVRIGADLLPVSSEIQGWNTIFDRYEEWVVVSINEDDNWKNIIRRTK